MDSQADKTVFLVDNDESVRRAMKRLIHLAGMNVRSFASIEEFLGAGCSYANACLVADVKIFEDGLGVQAKLADSGCQVPVIFVTSYDNRTDREKAKEMGAVAYFLKPVDDQALLDAIEWATH
ncbi:response regulator transcription factor [Planctomycetota bacterium]